MANSGEGASRNPTLAGLLQRWQEQHGSSVAIIDGSRKVTFSDLAENSRRLSLGLARLGVRRGDVVAVWLPNSVQWVELEFAITRLDAIVLGVNTKLRGHDVRQVIDEARARVLVVWPGFHKMDFLAMLGTVSEELPGSLEHVILVGDFDLHLVPEGLRSRSLLYEELFINEASSEISGECDLPCNAFSSSGTTSTPKLVVHTQRSLVTHSASVAHAFGYESPDAVILGTLPFCGVFGFNTFLAALSAGRPVVVQQIFDANEAVELIERHKVTHTNGSDEMLRRILASAKPAKRLASWREAGFANFTGDAHELVLAGEEAGKKFFQTYGSSEVQALMCYPHKGAGVERRSLGGGVPVSASIDVRIRDLDSGEVAADGVDGAIEISGPNVTVGYLNRSDTEGRTPDGYFRTGDLGRLQEGTDLVYMTRLGDALRLGGFLISPREIETYLEQLTGVDSAQVIGVGHHDRTVAVAFVIPAEGNVLDEKRLLERCSTELARFKVPQRILIIDSYPTTHSANGDKIQRSKLRDMAVAALSEEKST